jgi:predicted RND superfamily exporter protein
MQIDASADTLLLENDKDLIFLKKTSKRYASEDFLIVTFSPNDKNLLSKNSLNTIQNLSDEFLKLDLTKNVTSILNVPLLQSPIRPVKELLKHIPTLLSKGTNIQMAKTEFLNSPLYSQNLVSADFKTTAILIYQKKYTTKEKNHQNIAQVRKIVEKYKQNATINLGGISMVADDLISFVKYDLQTFSIVVFVLLVITLYILYGEIRWVLIPIFICSVSILATAGVLGFFNWKVTVISSNFISLQLIMNMSLVMHLVIKYKEFLKNNPNFTQQQIVIKSVVSMSKPSLFAVITTIAGFSSLVFSSILPVINFGFMMGIGLVLSFIFTFLLFPTILLLLPKSNLKQNNKKDNLFTTKIANFALKNSKLVLISSIILIIFSLTGANKLIVENSFIDYFKKDTDIYKGMKDIDQHLGGTTPLDIILTFKEEKIIQPIAQTNNEDEEEDFEDEFEEDKNDTTYWFTQTKMKKIRQVHRYLETLKPVGKVLSLSTLDEIGKILNNGKYLDGFELALLNKKLPQNYKKMLLSPYVDIQNNQARITARIKDSQPNLRRDELIKKIKKDLSAILNEKTEEFRLSNLAILYNNMLQSLFKSQISTLGVVVAILFFMFLILFRSFYIATLAIVANIIPVGVIFGFMGWMKIPLDMMTITIAAISLGIAVDNTIHYIHRFGIEYKATSDYRLSMLNAHKSIGVAMFYTSVIIMVGFCVLVLSNFVPTIYFGLLTLLAMFMAIVADLVLLPILLTTFKPFKK